METEKLEALARSHRPGYEVEDPPDRAQTAKQGD
jgi:hypothetical protein